MAITYEDLRKLNAKLSNDFKLGVYEFAQGDKIAKKAIKIGERDVDGKTHYDLMLFRIMFSVRRIDKTSLKTNKTLCINVSRAVQVEGENVITSQGLGFTIELKDIKRKQMSDIARVSEKLTTDVCHNLADMILKLDSLDDGYIFNQKEVSLITQKRKPNPHVVTYLDTTKEDYVAYLHYPNRTERVQVDSVQVINKDRHAENLILLNKETGEKRTVNVVNGWIMADLTPPATSKNEMNQSTLMYYLEGIFSKFIENESEDY